MYRQLKTGEDTEKTVWYFSVKQACTAAAAVMDEDEDSLDDKPITETKTDKTGKQTSKLAKMQEVFEHLNANTKVVLDELRTALNEYEDVVERAGWPLHVLTYKRAEEDTADLITGLVELSNKLIQQATIPVKEYSSSIRTLLDALPKM